MTSYSNFIFKQVRIIIDNGKMNCVGWEFSHPYATRCAISTSNDPFEFKNDWASYGEDQFVYTGVVMIVPSRKFNKTGIASINISRKVKVSTRVIKPKRRGKKKKNRKKVRAGSARKR